MYIEKKGVFKMSLQEREIRKMRTMILTALMIYKHSINIQTIIRHEEIGLRKKKAEA